MPAPVIRFTLAASYSLYLFCFSHLFWCKWVLLLWHSIPIAFPALLLLLQTAGACGGIAASLIRVPTEVVKQRMQTGQFTSASAAVRLIAAKEGFKGLYAGIGPRVLWIGIGGSIFFGVLERTKRLLRVDQKLVKIRSRINM